MTTWLKNKIVTIRKPHRCWGCATLYPAGTQLTHIVAVNANGFNNSYWCPICKEVVRSISDDDMEEGFAMGELKNAYPEKYIVKKEEGEKIQ